MAGRSRQRLDKALSDLKATSPQGQLSTLELDVDSEDSIKRAAQQVSTNFGRVDVLINNAATGNVNDDVRTRFEAQLKTNVLGPRLVAAHFRPLLLKSKSPYSIYVTSGAGSLARVASMPDIPSPPNPDGYHVSKAALNMVMLQEHIESVKQKLGIKVFAVCPGFVKSNLRGPKGVDGWGGIEAGDPDVAGQTLLKVMTGERDEDVGKAIHKGGVYPW
jgi:NAD(P)-dependent dehydrogenase (short-subunit alcohol dehydrogenase family)